MPSFCKWRKRQMSHAGVSRRSSAPGVNLLHGGVVFRFLVLLLVLGFPAGAAVSLVSPVALGLLAGAAVTCWPLVGRVRRTSTAL